MAYKTTSGCTRLIKEVQFVSYLAHNLLSVGQLLSSGHTIFFDNEMCVIKDRKSGVQLASVHMTTNRMFRLEINNVEALNLASTIAPHSVLWHKRYGHLNLKGMKILTQKNMVKGLPSVEKLGVCEACVYGKQAKNSFPSGSAWRASSPLQLIHADVCGPMHTASPGGSLYFLLFTDDFTRMSWVYFLRYKS